MAGEETKDVDEPLEHLNGLSSRQFHQLTDAAEHTLVMMTGRNPEAYMTLLTDLLTRKVMDADESDQAKGDEFLKQLHGHIDKMVAAWRQTIAARKEADK